MMSLSRGAGVLCDDLDVDWAAAFFLVAALTGRTPAERPLLDIVAEAE